MSQRYQEREKNAAQFTAPAIIRTKITHLDFIQFLGDILSLSLPRHPCTLAKFEEILNQKSNARRKCRIGGKSSDVLKILFHLLGVLSSVKFLGEK
jgi:hypothetical protein